MLAAAGLGILWLAAIYLMLLGLGLIFKPLSARTFLSAFAQTTTANLIEAGLRAVVGAAFVVASAETKAPALAVVIGAFLAISAFLMILMPRLHRQFARRSTSSVFAFLPILGCASLILAASLAWFIT